MMLRGVKVTYEVCYGSRESPRFLDIGARRPPLATARRVDGVPHVGGISMQWEAKNAPGDHADYMQLETKVTPAELFATSASHTRTVHVMLQPILDSLSPCSFPAQWLISQSKPVLCSLRGRLLGPGIHGPLMSFGAC